MTRRAHALLAGVSARTRDAVPNPTHVDPRAIAIDTRALAAFRILAASLIVADVVLRARNFTFFYTEEGVVPQSVATAMTADNAFSIYYYTTDSTVIAAFFLLTALVGLQLLVGYRTRLATIVAFLLVVSLDHHNPLVLSYADVLFRLLLFWGIFLPLGERWSIDALQADRKPRATVTSLASGAILSQMIFMYVLNGYHKTESGLWTGGEATPLILGLDNTTFLLGEFMRNVPTLLQFGGLTWYYILLFSPLLLVFRGRTRTLFVALFLGGHATFAVTVRIGAFPYVAIAGLILFLPPSFWDDLEGLVRAGPLARLEAYRDPLERAGSRFPAFSYDRPTVDRIRTGVYTVALIVAVGSVLVVPALGHLPVAGFVDDDGGPEDRIDDRAEALSLTQPSWAVFAPHPRTTDRYYVFPAETEGGETVDAYNGRELTYERPYDELQKQFGTYRERFYMNDVRRGGPGDVVSESLAEHLCESWGDEATTLTHLNMYVVSEDVTLETIDDPDERDRDVRRFYEHGCGDNQPTAIDPP